LSSASWSPIPFTLLFQHYDPWLHKQVARWYPPPGWTRDDLWQEASLAFWIAWEQYDPTRFACRFTTFATQVVHRRLTSAIRRATRQKQMLINHALSLEAPGSLSGPNGTDLPLIDQVACDGPALDAVITERLTVSAFYAHALQDLTPLERTAFTARVAQWSHQAIARQLDCSEKSVDNALQRARRKLQRHWQQVGESAP